MDQAARPEDSDWEGVRLHVVTGKGGTGKTTVAAALAIALASGGRRSLLVEVEGRQGIASLFEVPPLPYEERRVALAPDGGEVFALAVDPEAALMDYLEMYYRARRAGRLLERIGAVDFATTIAPGLRDVLLTGKVYEATKRRVDGRPVYDAVVLDAPPTGRIARFLNVNTEVVGLARVGPVRNQAESIMRLIRSPQTAVHVVTILEEMPVQETVDGVAELRADDLPVGGIVVNMMRHSPLRSREVDAAARGRLDRDEVVQALSLVGLADTVADGLLEEARRHAQRVRLERTARRTLRELQRPVYELALLSTGIDLGGLYELASALRAQGAA